MGIADAPKSSMQVFLKARNPDQTQRQNGVEYQNGTWDCCTERKTALSWPDWITKRYRVTFFQKWKNRADITKRSTRCFCSKMSKTRFQVFYSKMSKTAFRNWKAVPCVRIVSRKMRSWNATPCSNKPLPHTVQNHRRWTIRSPFRRRKRQTKRSLV